MISKHLGSCIVGCIWRRIHSDFIEYLQEGYKKLIINVELLILDSIVGECQMVQGLEVQLVNYDD